MKKNIRNHIILFYNVENLFDTKDNRGVRDSEFTPQGEKNWTEDKLEKKLEDLADTITSISEKHPIIVGLTEVENRNVALQLVHTDPLNEFNYELIHRDSPDTRGIDVCLFYDEDFVKYRSHHFLRIDFPWNHDIKTRDVLFFECDINTERTWVVVNHWPSRRSNDSEKKRDHVAKMVREKLDDLMERQPTSKILIMGDFNDEPKNFSIERHLKAKMTKNISSDEFYNLSTELYEDGKGTCVHDDDWLMIDQMMINRNLLQNNNEGWSVKDNEMHIESSEHLIFRRKGQSQPNQTYAGDRYVAGVSDHLPVYIKIDN